MNDRELARIYFDHHAQETDRRSQRRLTELMRMSAKHDAKCVTAGCPVSLRSFIAGDVEVHTAFNEELLNLDLPENDAARQHLIGSRYVLRVFFPQTGQAHTALFIT